MGEQTYSQQGNRTRDGSRRDTASVQSSAKYPIKYILQALAAVLIFGFLGQQSSASSNQSQSKQATGNAPASSGAASSASGAGSSNNPQAATAAQLTSAPAIRMVPVQITVPAQPGVPNSVAKSITVQVPAHALQGISTSAAPKGCFCCFKSNRVRTSCDWTSVVWMY